MIAAVLAAGPILAERELPAAPFVVGALAIIAMWSAWVIWRQWSSPTRSMAMRRFAADNGLAFRSRASVPSSMRSLPAMSEPSGRSGVRNLVTLVGPDRTILMCDRWFEPDETYRVMRWWTMAITALDIDASLVRIAPVTGLPPAGDGLVRIGLESAAFDASYRVLTDDVRFANGFCDQRMMSWFLSRRGPETFEVGGRWAAVSSPGLLAPADLPRLARDLEAFVGRIPAVVRSIRPA